MNPYQSPEWHDARCECVGWTLLQIVVWMLVAIPAGLATAYMMLIVIALITGGGSELVFLVSLPLSGLTGMCVTLGMWYFGLCWLRTALLPPSSLPTNH